MYVCFSKYLRLGLFGMHLKWISFSVCVIDYVLVVLRSCFWGGGSVSIPRYWLVIIFLINLYVRIYKCCISDNTLFRSRISIIVMLIHWLLTVIHYFNLFKKGISWVLSFNPNMAKIGQLPIINNYDQIIMITITWPLCHEA